jgi:hypothetical protein
LAAVEQSGRDDLECLDAVATAYFEGALRLADQAEEPVEAQADESRDEAGEADQPAASMTRPPSESAIGLEGWDTPSVLPAYASGPQTQPAPADHSEEASVPPPPHYPTPFRQSPAQPDQGSSEALDDADLVAGIPQDTGRFHSGAGMISLEDSPNRKQAPSSAGFLGAPVSETPADAWAVDDGGDRIGWEPPEHEPEESAGPAIGLMRFATGLNSSISGGFGETEAERALAGAGNVADESRASQDD